jgi:tetratricopeptide (TPR) repeat protein
MTPKIPGGLQTVRTRITLAAVDDELNSVRDSFVLGDVIQVTEVHGDLTISFARPGYHLDLFPVAPAAPDHDRARRQPSRLLMARQEVVPFEGRDELLADLSNWLTSRTAQISVRLLHAPGGQGKTRLAAHLARQHVAGWQVWRARLPLPTATDGGRLTIDRDAQGVLVVVDYADRWPVASLKALIIDLRLLVSRLPGAVPLRVLLLARSAGWWWNAVENWLDTDLDVPADSIALPPLGAELSLERIFRSAVGAFRQALRAPVIAVSPPAGAPGFDQVLTVHMAALAAVDAHLHGETPPEPHRVTEYLLQRERRHWYEWHTRADAPLRTTPRTISRAVCVATLSGPLPHSDGVIALRRTGIADSFETCGQVIDDHDGLYPAEDPGTVLEPLYPDRLGEDFLALTTAGGGGESTVDPWTTDAVARLLSPAPLGRPGQAVTVLVETSRRWPHVAERLLYPLLRGHSQIALHVDVPTLVRLTELQDVDLGALEEVERALTETRRSDQALGLAAITLRLADHRTRATDDPRERAGVHHGLAAVLTSAGLTDRALAAARTAVEFRREQLAEAAEPDEVGLSISLVNLGTALMGVGNLVEALETDREAVEVSRRLAAADPAHRHMLGSALVGLGNRATELSRQTRSADLMAEAFTCTLEAVRLFEQLPERNRTAIHALALNNLGIPLGTFGRPDDAEHATVMAVDICRGLAAVEEALNTPLLAMSLYNLAIRRQEAGRADAALAPARECTDLYRHLARAIPVKYDHALLNSLVLLSKLLIGLNRHEEALSCAEERVALLQQKARLNPSAHEPALAAALFDLAHVLIALERFGLALEAARASVRTQRTWAAAEPEVHGELLFQGLFSTAMALDLMGRKAAIPPVAEEALAVHATGFAVGGFAEPDLVDAEVRWLTQVVTR